MNASVSLQILVSSVLSPSMGFPCGSEVKASARNAGDLGSIPGPGRSPGEGNGNPLQDSCLENPMDRGAWWATVHGVAKSRTRSPPSVPTVFILLALPAPCFLLTLRSSWLFLFRHSCLSYISWFSNELCFINHNDPAYLETIIYGAKMWVNNHHDFYSPLREQ